ncbi:hypothetical protein Tco_1286528 [Tanacetum coccineum]
MEDNHFTTQKFHFESSGKDPIPIPKPSAITPDLPIPDSLIMEDEHLDTIPRDDLVPTPSESADLSDDERECDVPVNDESSPTFTTFSNPLFDSKDDFTSSDNESFSDEDVPKENFKIYLNPLFDEEIISTKIDPHCFNAESYLIESLLNRDTLIDSSPKFDYLLEEFSEPCNNQDFSDNYEPYDLQNECQYICCTICGDLHDDSQCTQLWCDYGEPICENYGGYHMDYQCTQPSKIEIYWQAEAIERQREYKRLEIEQEKSMQEFADMFKEYLERMNIQRKEEEKRIFEEAARQEEEKRIAKEKEAAELEAKCKIQECLNIDEKSIPQASTRSRKFQIDPTLSNFTISTKCIPLSDFEIPPVTPNVETVNSLSMGDKHLDTSKGSLESSVRDLVPIPS